jgi:amidase
VTDLDCFVPTSFGRAATGAGVLDHTTFVVKDLYAIAGHVSSYGMPRWRETHDASTATASAVERLLAAGAEMVGLTKLDSLAYSLIGNAGEGAAPVNPRYPERFTGGSSSGSASAVAGGLADIGLGTDTAGSIRIPAASCGLFSIRPTHGSIAADGVLPLAPSMDVVGAFAREPALLRDVVGVLSGDLVAPTPPVTRVLLAADTLAWIDADAADALTRAAAVIADRSGGTHEAIGTERFTGTDVADRFARVQGREIWAIHASWVDANLDCFLDEVRVRLERCRRFSQASDAEKDADLAARRADRDAFFALLGPGACLALPILHDLPPPRTASDDELVAFRSACFRLTAPSSLTGAPQVVVPVEHARSGNTYGLGLIGAPGADRALLDLAVRACDDGALGV